MVMKKIVFSMGMVICIFTIVNAQDESTTNNNETEISEQSQITSVPSMELKINSPSECTENCKCNPCTCNTCKCGVVEPDTEIE